MEHLQDEADLTALCAQVFDEAGLTRTQVSEAMGVSAPAVYYMINTPSKGMSALRKRFLREVGGMTVEGPAYYVEGDGYKNRKELAALLGVSPFRVDEAVETGDVETRGDQVSVPSAYTFFLNAEDEAEDETSAT